VSEMSPVQSVSHVPGLYRSGLPPPPIRILWVNSSFYLVYRGSVAVNMSFCWGSPQIRQNKGDGAAKGCPIPYFGGLVLVFRSGPGRVRLLRVGPWKAVVSDQWSVVGKRFWNYCAPGRGNFLQIGWVHFGKIQLLIVRMDVGCGLRSYFPLGQLRLRGLNLLAGEMLRQLPARESGAAQVG
jgi:hypothetical protein